MKKLVLILSMFMTASMGADQSAAVMPINTKSTVTLVKDRTVNILGGVKGIHFFKKANQIEQLSRTKGDIFLFINSPGGSVMIMENIVQAIEIAQRRGTRVRCVSTVYAASAAFSILAACDDRYAFAHTKLLFHPVRMGVSGPLTAKKAERLAKEMKYIDTGLKRKLRRTMKMEKRLFTRAYYSEKWWSATELAENTKGFITIISNLSGVDNVFQLAPTRAVNKKVKKITIKRGNNIEAK